eukprot:1149452-Pelagomonas_calceolata.AAC.2
MHACPARLQAGDGSKRTCAFPAVCNQALSNMGNIIHLKSLQPGRRQMAVRAAQGGAEGRRITQNEFTDKAWQVMTGSCHNVSHWMEQGEGLVLYLLSSDPASVLGRKGTASEKPGSCNGRCLAAHSTLWVHGCG